MDAVFRSVSYKKCSAKLKKLVEENRNENFWEFRLIFAHFWVFCEISHECSIDETEITQRNRYIGSQCWHMVSNNWTRKKLKAVLTIFGCAHKLSSFGVESKAAAEEKRRATATTKESTVIVYSRRKKNTSGINQSESSSWKTTCTPSPIRTSIKKMYFKNWI